MPSASRNVPAVTPFASASARLRNVLASSRTCSLAKNRSGGVERSVRVPEDGRRLLVSNYSEAELIAQERLWIWSGALLAALAVAVLMWGYVQRYEVQIAP